MDLHELRVAARLIDGLAKRALFAEKQMVALEGQCAEWRRIADELKAARNLTTATAESVIKERDALREDLRREEESHEETAQLLKTVDQKVRLLTQERDALRAQLDTERERHKQTASILAQYAPKTMQIEPPPEATHDTPEGKAAAESAVKREPMPWETVRLVKVPTQEDYPMQSETWNPEWGQVGETQHVDEIRTNSRGTRVAELESGWQWPLSCIEIVEDAK